MNKYLMVMASLLVSVMAYGSDDNEINIDQAGDTLTLYIDQSGDTLTLYIDQVGYGNKVGGDGFTGQSTPSAVTGDSNIWDWDIGYVGSADSSTLDVSVTGDSNTMDFDQGYVSSAERLDLDLTVIGSTNVFDVDVETDDVTFTMEVTGDNNNINTLQNDGFYQTLTFDLTGDNADVDINQISGTCAEATTSCKGIITMDVVSDDAIIQINQKDTAGDS